MRSLIILLLAVFNLPAAEIVRKYIPQSGSVNVTVSVSSTGNTTWQEAEVLGTLTVSTISSTSLSITGTLTAATVDINGGNIDGTVIGATSPSNAVFGTTTATTGNVTTLNATTINGTLATAAQPNITSLGSLARVTATTGDFTNLSGATFLGAVGVGGAATTNFDVISGSGNVNISLEADTASDDSIINFSDGSIAGGIVYDHGSNSLSLISAAAPSEANADLIVDGNGYVGIGTTTPSALGDNNKALSINAGNAQTAALILSENNSNYMEIYFQGSDNTSHINANTGVLHIEGADVTIAKFINDKRFRIEQTSAAPTCNTTGDFYVDDSDAICVCVAAGWTKLAGAGTCS